MIMNKLIRSALICSLVVAGYGLLFHFYNVSPHDWKAVAMWMPLYIFPIWGLAGASWLSERRKE